MAKICIKNEKLEVNKDKIWEGDLFDREIVANDFSKIITSISQPFVLSVNAPFGSGKSFFLERWEKQLSKDGEKTFIFNAWKCDFVEKPLLPFLYEFLERLKELGLVEYDFEKDLKDCKDILGTTFNEFIKWASMGIFDPQKLKDSLSKGLPVINGNPLNEYKKQKNAIKAFKETLKIEVAKRLKGKNIYVFVDELERCRPTFAIELLEAIKHLFDIEGLVFILGIDRNQLKHTVSTIYGQDMDGEGYLRRFIDLELSLPEPKIEQYTMHLAESFRIKDAEIIQQGSWSNGEDEFTIIFNLLVPVYELTLREIEQMYAEFNVLAKTIPTNHILITPFLAFLIILKAKNFELFNKLGNEVNHITNIEAYLNETIVPKLKLDNSGKQIAWENFKIILYAIFSTKVNLEEEYSKYSDLLERDQRNSKLRDQISFYGSALRINNSIQRYSRNICNYIKSKLLYTNYLS